MDNQQIKGYRDLSEKKIDLMNRINEKAMEVGELVCALQQATLEWPMNVDARWVSIGKTNLQQGFMALTRAIANPTTF